MQTKSELAVRAEGLTKRYGELTAVDGIGLRLQRGHCLGLLGPNGAGKTTTVEMLVGLTKPDGGTVEILGLDSLRQAQEIRERIGVQLQATELQGKLSVRETLQLFRSFYAQGQAIDEVVALIGMQEKAASRIDALSGGQKQRLSLGCALIGAPELLFLDEPTTGLDPQARRRVWEIVEEFKLRGGSVLLTTHYMDEAERLCDELVIIDHGRILTQGSPQAIIAQLGADQIVELHFAEEAPPSEAAEMRLREIPGVLSTRREGQGLWLSVQKLQAALPAILALLEREHVPIADLRTHRPTLEDVFVSLTGKHLRDA